MRYVGGLPKQDMTVCHPSETNWLLEGTGFTEVIPAFASAWSTGNRGLLTGNTFDFLETQFPDPPAM